MGKLDQASPGGAGRNRTLAMKALAAIEVSLPPIETQVWFDRACAKFKDLKDYHAQLRQELDALSKSLLQKALHGEL